MVGASGFPNTYPIQWISLVDSTFEQPGPVTQGIVEWAYENKNRGAFIHRKHKGEGC